VTLINRFVTGSSRPTVVADHHYSSEILNSSKIKFHLTGLPVSLEAFCFLMSQKTAKKKLGTESTKNDREKKM